MGDWGAKISARTKPVRTATGVDVLLTSARNNIKFPAAGSTILTFTGGIATATIAHGQTFKPSFLVFLDVTTGIYLLPTYVLVGLSDAYVDATNLVITLQGAFTADGTQYTCYYYLSETEQVAA